MLKVACIPAYNEGNAIADVVLRTKNFVDEVIVCDDGSQDNTLQNAKSAGAKIIVHDKNLGKGAALKSLFNYAKKINADIVVTIDGDGQFKPEEIPILLHPVLEDKYDIVIGYRYDANNEMPSYRKFGNKILDRITNLATDQEIKDSQSGFRAYSKKAIELIFFKTNGFGVDAEILVNASQKRLKMTEKKVTVLYKRGTKTSTKDPMTHSVEVVTSLIELIAIKHSLRYLGIPGFALIVIGIIFAITSITIFNETRYFSIPITLVAFGSILAGLILLLMSVLLFSINRILKSSE